MKYKYMYHETVGLGDHIINNGLVRHFYKKHNAIKLFALFHNVKNVEYMYRDLENFEVIGVKAKNYNKYRRRVVEYLTNNVNNLDILHLPLSNIPCYWGFKEHIKAYTSHTKYRKTFEFNIAPSCDMAYYIYAGVDFSVRFNEFYFERDLKKEKEVFNTLNPLGEKYIFIHDDASRGFSIDMNRIKTEHKVIMNDKRFSVFDYISLIENAEEIHFMQSSFKELICSYKLNKPTLYQHNYVRQYNDEYLHSTGLNPIIQIN